MVLFCPGEGVVFKLTRSVPSSFRPIHTHCSVQSPLRIHTVYRRTLVLVRRAYYSDTCGLSSPKNRVIVPARQRQRSRRTLTPPRPVRNENKTTTTTPPFPKTSGRIKKNTPPAYIQSVPWRSDKSNSFCSIRYFQVSFSSFRYTLAL